MADEESSEIKTDRKIIFLLFGTLITLLIASGSGFFVMYGKVEANRATSEAHTIALQQISEEYKTLGDIKVLVGKLVEKGDARNSKLDETIEIFKKYASTQLYIFGEQKRRRPLIDSVLPHINNRKIHK